MFCLGLYQIPHSYYFLTSSQRSMNYSRVCIRGKSLQNAQKSYQHWGILGGFFKLGRNQIQTIQASGQRNYLKTKMSNSDDVFLPDNQATRKRRKIFRSFSLGKQGKQYSIIWAQNYKIYFYIFDAIDFLLQLLTLTNYDINLV